MYIHNYCKHVLASSSITPKSKRVPKNNQQVKILQMLKYYQAHVQITIHCK